MRGNCEYCSGGKNCSEPTGRENQERFHGKLLRYVRGSSMRSSRLSSEMSRFVAAPAWYCLPSFASVTFCDAGVKSLSRDRYRNVLPGPRPTAFSCDVCRLRGDGGN